jgi:hypothetical protein
MNTNYYTWKNICSWRNIHTNMEFIRAYVKDLYILSHTTCNTFLILIFRIYSLFGLPDFLDFIYDLTLKQIN